MKLGTFWTAPGEGATVAELRYAFGVCLRPWAWPALRRLADLEQSRGPDARTNLGLVQGGTVVRYDFYRAEKCDV